MTLDMTDRVARTTVAFGSRVVMRRRTLPNGRAVVGALLVVVAGVGSFAVATRPGDTTAASYVVLVRPVGPGQRITAADLTMRTMTLDPAVADNAFSDPARVAGAVALAPLGAGQLLQRAEVATASSVDGTALPPAHELTIPVPSDRMPTGLRRGEAVAVLATYAGSGDARTIVTVQRALVLAVSEAGGSLTARGATRVTLALTQPEDVVETAHAAQVAELTLVRATLAAADLPATFTVDDVRPKGTAGTVTATRAGS